MQHMLLPVKTREHVLTGLTATPRVLGLLSAPLNPESPVWELSLPGRFTLRETMAHLADWDDIFLKRARSTLKGEASVEDRDSGKLGEEKRYYVLDPHDSLRRYAQARSKLFKFFRDLGPEDWEKSTTHPRHGAMSLEVQAVHVLGHDGYHLDAITTMMALAGLAEAGLAEPPSDQIGSYN
jgi:uncharacterized damage-inducible protein DinB